jgi:hypothetical protein
MAAQNNHDPEDVDGMQSADVDRIKGLSQTNPPGIEEFTVRFNAIVKSLTLFVNGVERNHIRFPEEGLDKFEACLKLIKNQFIAWRNPKN